MHLQRSPAEAKPGVQVKFIYGQESYERLKAAGSPIDFKMYRGLGHGVAPEEVQDIRSFIAQHI